MTWCPEGVLDLAMATEAVGLARFEEKVLDEQYDRFVDLSRITKVHLDFAELVALAAERRSASANRPIARSAFFANTIPSFAIAGMFAAFMEPSPIDVRVFRHLEEAAEWLGVTEEILREEA